MAAVGLVYFRSPLL